MMQVQPIAAFDDNYIWALTGAGDQAVVVDPGDAEPVLAWLAREGRQLSAILITHKHGDHVGGVADLLEVYPGIPVYGPANEPIRVLTTKLNAGDQLQLDAIGATFQVLSVPGHTEGHIAYYGEGCLFCGDTLFAGGCGRVFSGTHEQLHASLQLLAALPDDTKVYCAHEYTQANLGFARWVEPNNAALHKRLADTEKLRQANQPTVPSVLAEEKATNPFLRTAVPEVVAAAERYAGQSLPAGSAVFTAIRSWKDKEYD